LLLLVFGSVLPLYLTLVFLVGFFFGGSLVLFAAQTEKSFGTGSLAGVYPFIFVFYGLAALIGPSVAGALLDSTGVYSGLLILSGTVPLAGLIGIGLLKENQITQAEIKSQAA
jgi:OFA family oxalate/formate antiporter-like MFS transporter